MSLRRFLLTGLASCLAMTACNEPPSVEVTARYLDDATYKGTQSETAAAAAYVNGRSMLVVAYNDQTDDGKVAFTATDRIVYPGASMMGWSYSGDNGQHWSYGGKLQPTAGIGALWGDPAVTVAGADYARVYLSSLAASSANIPAGGHHGWFDDGALTGACIARSDDGGMHFAMMHCFSANGAFYDGGAMAGGSATDQRIFAAYWNTNRKTIDVWASPDGYANFASLPNPFPGMQMESHPELVYDRNTNALLVGAIDSAGFIYLNRMVGTTWQTPVQVSHATSGVAVPVGQQTIRTAAGFSFDVGTASVTASPGHLTQVNDDSLRLLYTTRDAVTKRIYVRGSACRATLVNCHDVPQWGTTPGNLDTPGDQFNPTVTAWRGFFTAPPVWKATYESTDDDPNGVAIKAGNLAVINGTPIFLPLDLVPARPVCPDLRYGTAGKASQGYWGDYNNKSLASGLSLSPNPPGFLLAFSDSSKGCFSQYTFTSKHLHVSAVVFQ